MKHLSLTLVLLIGTVGGVVIGYAAAGVSDQTPTFPTMTPEPTATTTPELTPTLHTTDLSCDDPAVRIGEVCVFGTQTFPRCSQMGLGPGLNIGLLCLNDGSPDAK